MRTNNLPFCLTTENNRPTSRFHFGHCQTIPSKPQERNQTLLRISSLMAPTPSPDEESVTTPLVDRNANPSSIFMVDDASSFSRRALLPNSSRSLLHVPTYRTFAFNQPAIPTIPSLLSLWNSGYTEPERLSSIDHDGVREYYERQNALLESFRAVDEGESTVEAPANATVRRAIILSNVCTALLLFAQLYSFIRSGSLSLLAVFVDLVLDVVSGIIVGLTWRWRTQHPDPIRYPVGRERLEPLGVIAMTCLMTAATLLTLEESITVLLSGSHESFTGLTTETTSIILIALVVKSSLYFYCKRIDNASVAALAQDHLNDTIANFVSLVTVTIAHNTLWWLDPAGGILVSLWIIRSWVLLSWEYFDQLLGRTADPDVLNLITYVACNHEHVHRVDTVRAYHVGVGIYAEVHIVLDEDMPLRPAHNVGEALQRRIENLAGIERCFIHLDFESDHSPHSEHKAIHPTGV